MLRDAEECKEKETSETLCSQTPSDQLAEEEPVRDQTETPDEEGHCDTVQLQSTTLSALTSEKSNEEESCNPPKELVNVNTHHVLGLSHETPEESVTGEFDERAEEVDDVESGCILIEGDISSELTAPSSAGEQEDVDAGQTAGVTEAEGQEE